MDLHERQQLDFLLHTAVERFVERIEQRNSGPQIALTRLRADPEQDGIGLTPFVQALFQDFLLDNVDGAAFILRALPRRKVDLAPLFTHESSSLDVSALLAHLAQALFAELLNQKAQELLEHHLVYLSPES